MRCFIIKPWGMGWDDDEMIMKQAGRQCRWWQRFRHSMYRQGRQAGITHPGPFISHPRWLKERQGNNHAKKKKKNDRETGVEAWRVRREREQGIV